MRIPSVSKILPVLAAAALLPLRSNGDAAPCCNVTTSLASTVNDPVNGDEAFFKLPTGPANVMFLLDTSGSMSGLPQCTDFYWDDGSAPPECKSPSLAAPSNPSVSYSGTPAVLANTYKVVGTCTPSTYTNKLAWMETVVPTRTYADPGQTNTLLRDCPLWGNGGTACGTRVCSGDGCAFDPDAYYFNASSEDTITTTSVTYRRRAHDTDTSFATKGCFALDPGNGYAPIKDFAGNKIDLGDACRTCMADHGFYFYRVRYLSNATVSKNWSGQITGYSNYSYTTTNTALELKGTFLNGNPPKHLTARNVIKSIAWMDPSAPKKFDQIRMGLSILYSNNSGGWNPTYPVQQSHLIIPLGPDKATSYPPTQLGFRQARQYLISALNGDSTIYRATSSTDPTITGSGSGPAIINSTISNGFFNAANGSTPFATALFNLGQYFSGLGLYTSKFGSSYEVAEFKETSSGLCQAPWVNSSACSMCWSCQNNSIVAITDGSPNSETKLPSTILNYDGASYTLPTNCDANGVHCVSPTDTSVKTALPRVASWLHNVMLREDGTWSSKEAPTTHPIGINITEGTNTQYILKATAQMGGGIAQNSKDPAELAAAVYNAVSQVIPKENSFSAASASSLQAVQTSASDAYLTRFKPNQSITWEGHLFQGALFDEYQNGCDPTKPTSEQPTVPCQTRSPNPSANFNEDDDPTTGLAICSGVFLIDGECDEITEDSSTGNYIKKGDGTPAKFPWDAGEVLSDSSKTGYRSADETASNARSIFTWVGGSKVYVTAANAATLLPYMNIDATWCTAFLTRIGVSGGTNPLLTCAQNVIYFVRGWDVLDQDTDSCAGPGKTNPTSCQRQAKGEERDRPVDNHTAAGEKIFWKLGDIFHSSPAVVMAPWDELRCRTGYEKQCVPTLFSDPLLQNQTPIDHYTVGGKSVDAYEAYRQDNLTRRKVVLVGSNDGMLHAFDAGKAITTTKDTFGAYTYDSGTGEELWAFVPPDLLPRLRTLLDAHQYMVDGSVMLRDVWVDGGAAGDPSTGDRKKQRDEYHTVAIFGRRSGGSEYSALDVTDPLNPKFLWNFPQSCSDDARYMAQSWSDFAPRPPPMGPVKIKSSDPRGFDERWIVMINGGYDPTLSKGRAVFMVDAWSGQTLWRFTDDDFKDEMGLSSANRAATSMFPVPAGIGLIDVGDTTKSTLDSDGFFDTATWGDMGGNLWVARFQDPGVVDGTTKRVTNWFAARTFEEQRKTDNTQYAANRNEFFYMTANAFEGNNRTVRTFLGSGNREQIMSQAPGCGADNIMGCCQAGCTKVTATTTDNYSGCTTTSTFSCAAGKLMHDKTTTSGTCTSPLACSATPAFTADVALHFECTGAPVTDRTGSVSCDSTGVCSVTSVGSQNIAGTAFAAQSHNRFYGVWSYGGVPKKMFADQATARTFDANRFTDDTGYSGTCTGPAGSKCSLIDVTHAKVTYAVSSPYAVNAACDSGLPGCAATVNDAGWFYEYGDVCPLKACSQTPPWTDEKTGSSATVVYGCAAWGGFRPFGMTGGADPCSGSQGSPANYSYFADYLSGVPTSSCFGDSSTSSSTTTLHRAGRHSTSAPPTGSTTRVTITPDGKVTYSVLEINSQPSNTTIQTNTEASEPVYWLEVTRPVHDCRHVNSTTCQ